MSECYRTGDVFILFSLVVSQCTVAYHRECLRTNAELFSANDSLVTVRHRVLEQQRQKRNAWTRHAGGPHHSNKLNRQLASPMYLIPVCLYVLLNLAGTAVASSLVFCANGSVALLLPGCCLVSLGTP